MEQVSFQSASEYLNANRVPRQVFPEQTAHKADPQASGNRLKDQRAKRARPDGPNHS